MTSEKNDWNSYQAGKYWDQRSNSMGVLRLGAPDNENGTYHLWTKWQLKKAIKQISLRNKTAVDLGCGIGRIGPILKGAGVVNLTGIDVSIRMAQSTQNDAYNNIVVGDLLELPFSDSAFDIVVCLGVLEHIPVSKFTRCLDEIMRIVGSGGFLVIETNYGVHNRWWPLPSNPFRRGVQLENGYVGSEVNSNQLFEILKVKGFQIMHRSHNPIGSFFRRNLFARLLPARIQLLLEIAVSLIGLKLEMFSDQIFILGKRSE